MGAPQNGKGKMRRPFGSAEGQIPEGGGWGGVRASVTRRLFPKSAGGYKYKITASFSSVTN